MRTHTHTHTHTHTDTPRDSLSLVPHAGLFWLLLIFDPLFYLNLVFILGSPRPWIHLHLASIWSVVCGYYLALYIVCQTCLHLPDPSCSQCLQNVTAQVLTRPSLSFQLEEEEMEILWSSVFTERLWHVHVWMHKQVCAQTHLNRYTHLSTHDMHTCAHSSMCTHTHTHTHIHAHPLNTIPWISVWPCKCRKVM